MLVSRELATTLNRLIASRSPLRAFSRTSFNSLSNPLPLAFAAASAALILSSLGNCKGAEAASGEGFRIALITGLSLRIIEKGDRDVEVPKSSR